MEVSVVISFFVVPVVLLVWKKSSCMPHFHSIPSILNGILHLIWY